jgi:hypothetical protein
MRILVRSAIACTLALALSAVYLAYQSALAQQSCVTLPSGAAAWYPFDGNALDVQSGNHAALSGSPAFAAGKVGQALQFDGVDDSAKIAAAGNLNIGAGGGMTIALWLNPADTNDHALVEWNTAVISGCDFCSVGTHLWMNRPGGNPGGLGASLVNIQGGSQQIQADPGTITANAYQHIALTYDKTSGIARLYRDGAVVAEKNVGSFTPQTSYDLYLGLRPAGGFSGPGRYKGAMDEVQIFNRALTQSDIQTIYNSGNSGTALCRQPDSIQFLTENLAINEVNGSVSLAVTRKGNVAGAATVQYATTTGGTATPNVDYTPTSGTLSFAEGEVTKTFTIPLNVDSNTEPDETIEVTLSNPTGGATLGTPSTEVVTIADPRSMTQPGRILTSTGSALGGIIEFNTDGSNTVNMTANTFDGGCGALSYRDSHPSVSRDGKLIAFQSNRDGTGNRIFVMNSDGTGLRQVTFNPGTNPNQPDDVDQDINPVISPDGTRIAFISGRTVLGAEAGPCSGNRIADVWIVNTDGTGLSRATEPQFTHRPDQCTGLSRVVSVVWNPANNDQFAIRGFRLVMEGDPPVATWHQVVSIGGGGTPLATFDSTGISDSLDWSPDGRYVGFMWGGEAQGAPPRRVSILDLQVLQDGKPTRTDLLGAEANNLTGLFRFSPDSQRFVVGIITDFNFSQGVLSFLNLDGSGRTNVSVPGWSPYDPIWWQPAVPITAPRRLEVTPDPVTVWEGQSVQMIPALLDTNGNVIVRAAGAWRLGNCFNGGARISHTGLLTGSANINYTGQVCASNGGVSDCATLQNFDIPILSVNATQPQANRSGAGAPGVFTITRVGNPNTGLAISFALGGTAIRDVDYFIESSAAISGDMLIMPSGTTSVTINVRAISNSTSRGDKSVILTLQPDPSNYFVNDQSKTARVTLRDDGVPPPSCAAPPSNLVAWYRAEDNANDSKGANHATLQNGTSFALGKVGQALNFDGADDQVVTPTINLGSQFSVELWASPTSSATYQHVMLNGWDSPNFGALYYHQNHLEYWQGGALRISSPAVPLYDWTHIALVYDGSVMKLYVNGQLAGTSVEHAETFNNAVMLGFGFPGDQRHFAGLLDEASLYNSALSSSEVQAIYAGDRAGKCTSAATPTPTPTPAFSLSAITPDKGGDTGSVTTTIYGQSIQPGATAKLTRNGQSDIVGSVINVAASGASLKVSFYLAGKARGTWDVVVTNPDNVSATLPSAFTIEAGRDTEIWVDVIGRDLLRVGRQQSYYIIYGNRGNVNAGGIPAIRGIPPGATWKIDYPAAPIIGGSPVDWDKLTLSFSTGQETFIPLPMAVLAPGQIKIVRLKLTLPVSAPDSPFNLGAVWMEGP